MKRRTSALKIAQPLEISTKHKNCAGTQSQKRADIHAKCINIRYFVHKKRTPAGGENRRQQGEKHHVSTLFFRHGIIKRYQTSTEKIKEP